MKLALAAVTAVSAYCDSIAAHRRYRFRKVPAALFLVIAWTVALAIPANDMNRPAQDIEADLAAEREHTTRLGNLLGAERERNTQLAAQVQAVGVELLAERKRNVSLAAQLQAVGAELTAERERNAPLAAQLQAVGAELTAERKRNAPLAAQLQAVGTELAAERERGTCSASRKD